MIDFHANGQDAARLRLWAEPRATNLSEMLTFPAERYPDVVAIGLCHHGAEPEAITWGELHLRARCRSLQLSEHGLRKGDRVMIVLPTSGAFFEFFFGAVLAGAIPVPAAPPTSLREPKLKRYRELLSRIAIDSEATVFVAPARTLDVLREGLALVNRRLRLLASDGLPVVDTRLAAVEVAGSDIALLQYTSGSTSNPKGVALSHSNIIANAAAIAKAVVEPDTVCVSWLPLYHDMGLIGTFLSAIYCRTVTVFMPPQAFVKSPALWLGCISDHRATVTVAPNFAFVYSVRNIVLEDLREISLDSLRTVLNGAEPVNMAAVKSFYEKFKVIGLRDGVVRAVYGLAESSLAVTFSEPGPMLIDKVDADCLERNGLALAASETSRGRSFVSVGTQLCTQQVRIVDSLGRTVQDRHIGQILVKGPSVMQGYFNRSQETNAVLRDGWLHTGDLGYLAAGQLYVTGRAKEVIIRNGKNYYPQDIEACIETVRGVMKGGAAAFSIEGDDEPKVVVVVETRIRDPQLRSEMLMQIKIECINAFLFGPDEMVIVPPGTIPRTTSGKIRRNDCRHLVSAQNEQTALSLDVSITESAVTSA